MKASSESVKMTICRKDHYSGNNYHLPEPGAKINYSKRITRMLKTGKYKNKAMVFRLKNKKLNPHLKVISKEEDFLQHTQTLTLRHFNEENWQL